MCKIYKVLLRGDSTMSHRYPLRLFGFLVFLAFLIGLGFGLIVSNLVNSFNQAATPVNQKAHLENLPVLKQIERFVVDNFFGEVITLDQSQHELAKTYISLLKDQNSFYLTPEEADEYIQSMSHDFEGIGIILQESETESGVVQIVGVIEGSPASREPKIQVNSKILKVQDESVVGKTVQEVASRIRGPANTSVNITLRSPSGDINTVNINREEIKVPKITLRQYPSLTYVRLIDFIDSSVSKYNFEWNDILNQIIQLGNEYIILDLRTNSGGYVESAIHISNSFLRSGNIILKEIDSKGIVTREVKAVTNGPLANAKIFILIDKNTASAAEILTLALKENNSLNVTVVGEKSFGKGTEQKMISNVANAGGLLNITYQKWASPSGRILTSEDPIVPDIFVSNISDLEADEIVKLVKGLISESKK